MELPAISWLPLLPLMLVAGTGFVVLVADLFVRDREGESLAWLSLFGLAAAGLASIVLWGRKEGTLSSTYVLDDYALFFGVLACAATALTVLMSVDDPGGPEVRSGESYALALFSTAGMVAMAAANDLIVVFLALEVMSIGVYVLAGLRREEARSSEAALKYFLLGALAAGFLLFGIALVYGATGTTRLQGIAARVSSGAGEAGPFVRLGAGLLLVGFGFKVAAVPFHVWTPDVYEGAPTPVTALMAVGVKAAAFAALVRVFGATFAPLAGEWNGLLWGLAAATMTVGNLLAISQTNIKRMLAYSSIAHAGYALVALVAGTAEAGSALLFYLLAYGAMNLGAFAVVIALGRAGEPNEEIPCYAGLAGRRPLLAAAMAAFLLSLAGVPPLAGFAAKFYVFGAAVQAGYVGLAVVGVLNSLVSAYYYLWVIVQMYMYDGNVEPVPLRERPYLATTIGLSFAATVLFGILPGLVYGAARSGFAALG